MPVFNAEVTIDVDDNVSIILPDGRLLNYADQTTIVVTRTENGKAAPDINISVTDKNKNHAIGKTDEMGMLKVPNSQSSTGSDNGTVGKDDNDIKDTFVIKVNDKTNAIIPDCEVYIGKSNNLVVNLPDGIKPTTENPVIITVTDENGNAKDNISVIALGSADYIEKGKTDIYGKVTLPITNEGYTDENGKVNVNAVNVIVNRATGRTPDEDYITKNVTTLNRFADLKNNSHWGYFSIMEAANTHKAVTSVDSESWVK